MQLKFEQKLSPKEAQFQVLSHDMQLKQFKTIELKSSKIDCTR